MTPMK